MLPLLTARGNDPNFTFLTTLLLLHPLSVFPFIECTMLIHCSERLHLRMVYILLIFTAFTQCCLLPHYPDYTSHKDSLCLYLSIRGAAQYKMDKRDFSTISKPFSILLSLYTVTNTLKVFNLQHKLNPGHYSSISCDFPLNSIYSENLTDCSEGCMDSN